MPPNKENTNSRCCYLPLNDRKLAIIGILIVVMWTSVILLHKSPPAGNGLLYITEKRNTTSKYIATTDGLWFVPDFAGCKYTNCVVQFNASTHDVLQADVLIAEAGYHHPTAFSFVPSEVRTNQIWMPYTHESPSYHHNKWHTAYNDYDASMNYRRDADVYHPYGTSTRDDTLDVQWFRNYNYTQKKTKGAFAYVSNCGSHGYDRLDTMRELAKFFDVDIFGECTKNIPCPRLDAECEDKLHPAYRFYLAFENSLCRDYITEKFWKTLSYNHYIVPVVIGGLDSMDYTSIAPPDSFIHAYNFTSMKELGNYLDFLSANPERYNRYHQWRANYRLTHPPPCELCRIANEKTLNWSHKKYLADNFNDVRNCRSYSLAHSVLPMNLFILIMFAGHLKFLY